MALAQATIKITYLEVWPLRHHVALMGEKKKKKTFSVIPTAWGRWSYFLRLGSGGRDIRGLHDDTRTHLMRVAGRRRRGRVLGVGRRPAVAVVADERGRVSRAGDPEVGFVRSDEGGHARKRTCGNPENCCAVVPPPHCADALSGEKNIWKRKDEEECKSKESKYTTPRLCGSLWSIEHK